MPVTKLLQTRADSAAPSFGVIQGNRKKQWKYNDYNLTKKFEAYFF